MRKIISILVLLFVSQSVLPHEGNADQNDVYVWICTGSSAYAYHSHQNCSGLNRCSAEIKMVTLHDAIVKWRRDKCKKCYKTYYNSSSCSDDSGFTEPHSIASSR